MGGVHSVGLERVHLQSHVMQIEDPEVKRLEKKIRSASVKCAELRAFRLGVLAL